MGCAPNVFPGGDVVQHFAQLIGIDLSPDMIDIARRQEIYDRLEVAEVTEWLHDPSLALGAPFREGRFPVIYGAHINVQDGQTVEQGDLLASWDPFTTPIITEVGGTVKFGDLVPGKTMQEKVDPVTGKSSRTVIESKSGEERPRVSIKDEDGKTADLPGATGNARYMLPVTSMLCLLAAATAMEYWPAGGLKRKLAALVMTLVLVPTLYFIGMDLHRLIFGAEEPVPPGEVSIDSGTLAQD